MIASVQFHFQGFSYDYVFDWNTKKNVSGARSLNEKLSSTTLTASFLPC